MRRTEYRMDVLRGGVKYSELRFRTPPSVYADADAAIKMSMRGDFLHNPDVDYITDELRPMMIVNGVEHPLGVYKIVTRSGASNVAGVMYEGIEAYDRGQALRWAKLEHRDYWPAGTAYETVITSYLTRAGIRQAAITSTALTLASDREDWDIGTDFLTIINTLLKEINYSDIWFDANGVAQVQPYVPPSAATIDHQYGAAEGLTVLRPEYNTRIDLYNRPNVFIAILENPEYDRPMVKTAVNDVLSSSLSTVRRGLRIPQVYRVDNIASEDELQAYADRLRDESMQLSEFVDIQTANMPGHGIGDTIALVHPKIQGIFREKSWEMSLQAGGLMSHTLQRVVIV